MSLSDVAAALAVSEETIEDACGETEIPALGVIEQQWETNSLSSTEARNSASTAVKTLDFSDVPKGSSVAIGVGSRGIANLPEIVSGVVKGITDMGYDAFIFPAMGSHGGATAAGQRDKLATLGVTEDSVGCPIKATMDTIQVGTTQGRDVPVVADANAAAADAIIPVNRVKPHTDFDGTIESGLSKMTVIGMGKQRGAKIAHDWAVDWSLRNMIPEITPQLLDALPIVGGVAIVEDQYDETTLIEGVESVDFLEREKELLERATELMPTLPFDTVDVLIVDEQGKDISGQGMDTNVIGRRPFAINEPAPDQPSIKRIYTRGLTDATHGNAMGMGSADFVHEQLVAALEPAKSLINALTASTPRGVRLPPVMKTDRAGLIAALSTIGVIDPDTVRILRVTDTMHLERMYASKALIDEARTDSRLKVVQEPRPVEFTNGDFMTPSPHQTD